MFVRLFNLCLLGFVGFSLPLGGWEELQFVIVALPGLSSYHFIPRHTIVAGYHGFTLVVRVSVRLSVCRPSVRPFFVSGL